MTLRQVQGLFKLMLILWVITQGFLLQHSYANEHISGTQCETCISKANIGDHLASIATPRLTFDKLFDEQAFDCSVTFRERASFRLFLVRAPPYC